MLSYGVNSQIYGRFIPLNGKKSPILIEDHSGGMTYPIDKSKYDIVKRSTTMQKTDLEKQEAVISAMAFAYVAWGVSDDEVAAQDLIAELSVLGYKIVKDTDA